MKNEYRIDGETTYIKINKRNGEYIEALIDTEDLVLVKSKINTWVSTKNNSGSYYVLQQNPKPIYLHRLITNAPPNKFVDHINHNTLDNRKENLRLVSNSENKQNLKNYKCYSFKKDRGLYVVGITLNKKWVYGGSFETEEEAEKRVEELRAELLPFSKEALKKETDELGNIGNKKHS